MKTFKFLVLLAIVFSVNSCSTSYITSTWKSPDLTPASFKNIMVVGIIKEADRSIREKMEVHLVSDLKSIGYTAFSAYEVYGPKAFEAMDEKQVTEFLAKENIDAVLTVVLLDKEKERYYVPERIVYSPYVTIHNRFWGYYRSIYTRIETPGYYQEETKYFWESNLYDLNINKLIYSVQTQSFDPSSIEVLAREYGQKILQSMQQNKILVTPAQKDVKEGKAI